MKNIVIRGNSLPRSPEYEMPEEEFERQGQDEPQESDAQQLG
jgi:hypothetical protein